MPTVHRHHLAAKVQRSDTEEWLREVHHRGLEAAILGTRRGGAVIKLVVVGVCGDALLGQVGTAIDAALEALCRRPRRIEKWSISAVLGQEPWTSRCLRGAYVGTNAACTCCLAILALLDRTLQHLTSKRNAVSIDAPTITAQPE